MMDDLWSRGITADGATASPEQLRAAWEYWRLKELKTATTLENCLLRAGVRNARCWPLARVADRMLQRARKAGAIKFVRGRWEFL